MRVSSRFCAPVLGAAALALAPVLSAPAAAASRAAAQRAAAPAAPRFTHESWSVGQGLPISTVLDLVQGRDGYLWLATYDGLVRFDGLKFTVFTLGNTPGMSSNRLARLHNAGDGTLWIFTESAGVMRMRDGVFSTLVPHDAIGRLTPTAWHFDAADTLTVVTERGAFVLHGDEFVRTCPALPNEAFQSVYRERNGGLWASRRGAVYRSSGEEVERFAFPAGVTAEFVEQVNGEFWIRTPDAAFIYREGRLQKFEPLGWPAAHTFGDSSSAWSYPRHALPTGQVRVSDGRWELLRDRRAAVGTSVTSGDDRWYAVGRKLYRDGTVVRSTAERISAIFVDRDEDIWFATDNDGLHRLQPATVAAVGARTNGGALNVASVAEDGDGGIWLGSLNDGVLQVRGTAAERTGPAMMCWTIHASRDGRLLAGVAPGRGVWQLTGSTLKALPGSPAEDIFTIYQDRAGALWCGGRGSVWCNRGRQWQRFGAEQGLPPGFIRRIVENPEGHLWFASALGGVARWRNGCFEVLDESAGLSSGCVRGLYRSADGVWWIGTEGRGLNRVQLGSDGSFAGATVHRLGTAEGLYDDGIHAIVEDGLGRMWMSTNRGIFWVPRQELEAFARGEIHSVHSMAYTERDGMANREANGFCDGAALRAHDGRLWFATQNGAAVVDPRDVGTSRPGPRARVEAVVASRNAVAEHRDAKAARTWYPLAAPQRDFEVHYTGIAFRSPENVLFRYRLLPFDPEWVEAGTRRMAHYSHVPPGEYRFEVQASDGAGGWPERGAEARLVVAPHAWETTGFRGSMAFAAALGLLLLHRERDRRARCREAQLHALIAARTQELQGEKAASERAAAEATRARRTAEFNHDMAERARRTIEEQARALREVDVARARFFANVSHEFRTPLTLIQAPLQDLREGLLGPLRGEVQQHLDTAIDNTQRLLRLVEQLMDSARIESGQMVLEVERHDIAPILRRAVAAFEPLAARHNLRLAVDVPASGMWAEVDEEQVEKVFVNLLGNAVKFTPPGGTVELRARVDGGGYLITVADTGPGIAAEHLARVFERFYQAASPAERRGLGTGLGLALSREICELHGGTIEAGNRDQGGAVFSVRLPCAAGVHADAVPATGVLEETWEELSALVAAKGSGTGDAAAADHDSRTTVLVVDDNAEIRTHVRRRLSAAYRVVEAADGVEALEAIRADLPDVVVTDIMMPRMDGLELCRHMKADAEMDFIPVILLTSKSGRESRLEGLECGADEYLQKPFDGREIVTRIHNLVQTQRRLAVRLAAAASSGTRLPRRLVPEPPGALPNEDDAFLAALRAALESGLPDEDFGVDALATAMGTSRTTLYRRVLDVLELPPSDLLWGYRLERAAQLLEARAGNVSEVAYAVGFRSIAHFSRRFRERFAVTPKSYRADSSRKPMLLQRLQPAVKSLHTSD